MFALRIFGRLFDAFFALPRPLAAEIAVSEGFRAVYTPEGEKFLP